MVGALAHMVLSGPPQGLETAVTYMSGQSPIKTLDTNVWVSLPSRPHSVHMVTYYSQESKAGHKSTGRGQLEALHWELSRTLPDAPLPLADFNWYPFPLTNCYHEYISFP